MLHQLLSFWSLKVVSHNLGIATKQCCSSAQTDTAMRETASRHPLPGLLKRERCFIKCFQNFSPNLHVS